jgi:hypothetical protein
MVVTALFTGAESAAGNKTAFVHCANEKLFVVITKDIRQKKILVILMIGIFTVIV